MLGGHADGVRQPVLSVLVQPLFRAELQEEPHRARRYPAGGNHRGGRHRDPAGLVLIRKTFFFFFLLVSKHIKIPFENCGRITLSGLSDQRGPTRD